MTEPSRYLGAAAPGIEPAHLLRWPARIPLNHAPAPQLEPVIPQEESAPAIEPGSDVFPARRGISVPETEQVVQQQPADQSRPLGRPGPGVLAGAAIAGLLLVVAPLALSVLQRPETVATVPVAAGQDLQANAPASDLAEGGDGADGDEAGGYVPESLPQDNNGASDEGGDGDGGGESGGGGDGGDLASGGAPGGSGVATDAPEQNSGSDGGGGNDGDGDGGDGDDGDAPGGGEGSDGGDPVTAGAEASEAPSPDDGEDPTGGSSSESSADPSFTALTGPGCPSEPNASYGTTGRDDNANGWATRDGGYSLDGCDGEYDAIPVSGTTEHGDGQFAYWSFSPGFPEAQCDVFVYVPEDESPRWVGEQEAMYQIFPGPEPSGSAEATFGVPQAEYKGGWVKATGFVSPTERFTVQLTNIGENALAGQEGETSHVAASAVRTECS